MYDIQGKGIDTTDQRYLTTNTVVYDNTATLALHSAIKKTQTNAEGKPHYSRQDT